MLFNVVTCKTARGETAAVEGIRVNRRNRATCHTIAGSAGSEP